MSNTTETQSEQNEHGQDAQQVATNTQNSSDAKRISRKAMEIRKKVTGINKINKRILRFGKKAAELQRKGTEVQEELNKCEEDKRRQELEIQNLQNGIDKIVCTYNPEPYDQYLKRMAETNRNFFHATLSLNPIMFKNGEYPSPSINNIRDIHALDIDDVRKYLHQYGMDVDETMPLEEITAILAELLGVPSDYIEYCL